jgi:hypothetical protein
MIEEHIA